MVDKLAMEGALATCSFSVPRALSHVKNEIHEFYRRLWGMRWKNLTTCRQTRLMLPKPTSTYAKYFLQCTRQEISWMVQFLSGHNYLKYHLFNTGRASTDKCRLCQAATESSWHLLTDCEPLMFLRFQIFFNVSPSEAPKPCLLYTSPSPRDRG